MSSNTYICICKCIWKYKYEHKFKCKYIYKCKFKCKYLLPQPTAVEDQGRNPLCLCASPACLRTSDDDDDNVDNVDDDDDDDNNDDFEDENDDAYQPIRHHQAPERRPHSA